MNTFQILSIIAEPTVGPSFTYIRTTSIKQTEFIHYASTKELELTDQPTVENILTT